MSRVDGRLKVTGATPLCRRRRASVHVARGRRAEPRRQGTGVRRVRKDAALAVSGVVAVLDCDDVTYPGAIPKDMTDNGGLVESRSPLIDERIHFAGQPIALVLAETLAQATEAAAYVYVDYEVEPWRLTLEEGLDVATYPDCFDGEPGLQHVEGDTDAGLERAQLRIKARYTTAITHQSPIEVPSAIASWIDGRLTVHSTTRNLVGTRRLLAGLFAVAPEAVRVIFPFVGGAFGSKGFLFDYAIMAVAASRYVGRPVKLVFSRRGMFEDHGHRPRTVMEVSLGAQADGQLTAVRHLIDTQTSEVSDFTEPCGRATMHLYATPAMEVRNTRAVVNTSSPCPMRGPGESSGGFAIESAMDELAEQLAIDPVDFRMRNLPGRDPMTGMPWSTYHLAECLDTGRQRFGWDRRDPALGSMRIGDEIAGYGMSCAVYPELRGKATARALLDEDGGVTLASATHDAGHGTYSVMSQIAADLLGLPIERVRFRLGDSDYPEAPPSGGSRTTSTVGSAVLEACTALMVGNRSSRYPGPGVSILRVGSEVATGRCGQHHVRRLSGPIGALARASCACEKLYFRRSNLRAERGHQAACDVFVRRSIRGGQIRSRDQARTCTSLHRCFRCRLRAQPQAGSQPSFVRRRLRHWHGADRTGAPRSVAGRWRPSCYSEHGRLFGAGRPRHPRHGRSLSRSPGFHRQPHGRSRAGRDRHRGGRGCDR